MQTPSTTQPDSSQSTGYFTPLFWCSLAFLGGIILAPYLNLTARDWLILSAVFLLLFLIPRLFARFLPQALTGNANGRSAIRNFIEPAWMKITMLSSRIKSPLSPGLLLAIIALGAARYQASIPILSPGSLAYSTDSQQVLFIEGIVIKPPDFQDDRTNLIVRANHLRPTYNMNYIDVDGLLLAQLPPGINWHYGDRVRLQGELRTPPTNEEFSYRDYLARQGIYVSVS